jgi:5'-methylthioadenosine phosphorylase
MKEIGVRRIIGPSACGSLKRELEPGTFVICDQFVDRTQARESTFYDGPQTTHVSAADPYCPQMSEVLAGCARELEIPVVEGGTIVIIQGPRFSTRAESRWYADSGFDVINMTQYPECWLARELELCYANISMVTDHDVGVQGTAPVSHEQVVTVFNQNNEKLRELLLRCEEAIAAGDVEVKTFEAFIRYQQELSRRAWSCWADRWNCCKFTRRRSMCSHATKSTAPSE